MCRTSLKMSSVIGFALLLGAFQAQARLISPYHPRRIADEAEVIVVGEVIELTCAGAVPAEQTKWRTPLADMRARVRVLRCYPGAEETKLAAGDTISVPYLALQPQTSPMLNGPSFPSLSVGDVFAFPLCRANGEANVRWELLDEEDHGLLVPCVKPVIEAPRGTGVAFLLAELAGTFARGQYQDLIKAGRYVGWPPYADPHLARAVYNRVAQQVADDEARWVNIFVATYCAMGSPRPSIGELLQGYTGSNPQAILSTMALAHIPDEGRDDRILATAIEHADVHRWGTGVMLSQNYPRLAAALPLTRETPEAVKGLRLKLSTHRTRYPVGSECRLEIELKNVSDRYFRIWVPHHRFDIKLDEIDRDGRSVSHNVPHRVGVHDSAVWVDDIVNLTSGMSLSLPRHFGRNIPGTVSYTVTYSNKKASLRPEWYSAKIGDIWTGTVTSNTVTVEFYDDNQQ